MSEWLTTGEAAEIINRVRTVEHNRMIAWPATENSVWRMCRNGRLQEMGIRVDRVGRHWHIHRGSLLGTLWSNAGQMAAQAAAEMGMTMEEFIAGARPMYEFVLSEREAKP